MIKDPQIVRIRKWLVRINIVVGILIGALIRYLIEKTFFLSVSSLNTANWRQRRYTLKP